MQTYLTVSPFHYCRARVQCFVRYGLCILSQLNAFYLCGSSCLWFHFSIINKTSAMILINYSLGNWNCLQSLSLCSHPNSPTSYILHGSSTLYTYVWGRRCQLSTEFPAIYLKVQFIFETTDSSFSLAQRTRKIQHSTEHQRATEQDIAFLHLHYHSKAKHAFILQSNFRW